MNPIDRLEHENHLEQIRAVAELLNTFADSLRLDDPILRSNVITLLAERLILGALIDDED